MSTPRMVSAEMNLPTSVWGNKCRKYHLLLKVVFMDYLPPFKCLGLVITRHRGNILLFSTTS